MSGDPMATTSPKRRDRELPASPQSRLQNGGSSSATALGIGLIPGGVMPLR